MAEEKIIVGADTCYPLNGILTLPEGKEGAVPAVVLVHGSGPSNMDEKVGKLTPFRDLAEGLAAHGIASLRYDKRTFAHGRKMKKDGLITVWEETIEDALLATKLLREDPRIDPTRVFLLGHSMGAMLAPRIDAEGGNYHGLILLAGTPRTLEEVMIDQSRDVLAQMNPILRWLAKGQIKKTEKLLSSIPEMSDEEAKKKSLGAGATAYYFKEMSANPAKGYLKDLTKPILLLQGGKDFQVSLEKDFNAYKAILHDRPNAEFKLYENLDHAFVPAIYDNIMKAQQEYAVERHIGSDVISDIAKWITGNK
ncbi:MAG: alpha/beta hydrolase [Ruminococcaceae bacterium]|nr:alpha/beta hydrolase [Oscillospiraceae bacterium]